MRRMITCAVAALLTAVAANAAQTPLVHVSSIDLSSQFNSTTGYGQNPLSIAFDGTNAYVGGYNSTAAAANIGVVKVSTIFGGTAGFAPLPNTQFSSPATRGLDALAYEGGTGSLIMAHDGGTAATSFISRRNASDGSSVWSMANPQGARPWAMAVDPLGDNGSAGVGFLVSGSGRRRLLSLATGANIFDGTNGGIINTSPLTSTNWRALEFDDLGNVVVGNQDGYGYGVRNTNNQWKTLAGVLNLTTRSVLKNVATNNVGQGIVVLEDVGSDLLAMSGRAMTTFTDSLGGVTTVADTKVHIRKLDGSVTDLTQIVLNGDEDGIGAAWAGNIKNLAFGVDGRGRPVLVVVDYVGRRLDVYVPEPATLGLLGVSALLALVRGPARSRKE